MQPHFEPIDLNDVIDDVLHDANFEAFSTGATISYQRNGEIKVTGDAGLLHSAVENLVRNAMFYSGSAGKIDVALAKAGDSAVITVRDNGPGVPENALPLLFKPFYRVDDSREPHDAEWGSHSAIVRMPVASMAEVLWHDVSPHGLEVELRLPVTPLQRDDAVRNIDWRRRRSAVSYSPFAPRQLAAYRCHPERRIAFLCDPELKSPTAQTTHRRVPRQLACSRNGILRLALSSRRGPSLRSG